MAEVKVAGSVYVIESAFTREEIKTVEKYRPNLLKLFDEDKRPVFAVGVSDEAKVGQFGIQFNADSHGEDKVACVTMPLPKGTGSAKELVVEAVGTAILNLNKVEENISVALAEIEEEKAAIAESVTVL